MRFAGEKYGIFQFSLVFFSFFLEVMIFRSVSDDEPNTLRYAGIIAALYV